MAQVKHVQSERARKDVKTCHVRHIHEENEKHQCNETAFFVVVVTEANQCRLCHSFVVFFPFLLFPTLTWHIALKWKQQISIYIYNKINGRQIVSTVLVFCFSSHRVCTNNRIFAFSLVSAQCLEVNTNKRMKTKLNSREQINFNAFRWQANGVDEHNHLCWWRWWW